jgi:hypothetical protein
VWVSVSAAILAGMDGTNSHFCANIILKVLSSPAALDSTLVFAENFGARAMHQRRAVAALHRPMKGQRDI